MTDRPTLTAYTHRDTTCELRPGTQRRAWMNRTRDKFAYRCLPMTIAISHGWEVIGDTTFTAVWNGLPDAQGVQIDIQEPGELRPSSHFGDGIITFTLPFLFRTDEDIGLWVSGSPNQIKHGIAPLTGLVETDWAPMTFTMNWKLTQRRVPVTFRAGEPICFFFPLDRTYISRLDAVMRPLSDDPELDHTNAVWAQDRSAFNKSTRIKGSEAQKQGWQKDYHKGRYPPDGEKARSHVSKIVVPGFHPPKASDI